MSTFTREERVHADSTRAPLCRKTDCPSSLLLTALRDLVTVTRDMGPHTHALARAEALLTQLDARTVRQARAHKTPKGRAVTPQVPQHGVEPHHTAQAALEAPREAQDMTAPSRAGQPCGAAGGIPGAVQPALGAPSGPSTPFNPVNPSSRALELATAFCLREVHWLAMTETDVIARELGALVRPDLGPDASAHLVWKCWESLIHNDSLFPEFGGDRLAEEVAPLLVRALGAGKLGVRS